MLADTSNDGDVLGSIGGVQQTQTATCRQKVRSVGDTSLRFECLLSSEHQAKACMQQTEAAAWKQRIRVVLHAFQICCFSQRL